MAGTTGQRLQHCDATRDLRNPNESHLLMHLHTTGAGRLENANDSFRCDLWKTAIRHHRIAALNGFIRFRFLVSKSGPGEATPNVAAATYALEYGETPEQT